MLKRLTFVITTESTIIRTEIDDDTPLTDIPPTLKYLLYSCLYPFQSRGPGAVMEEGCRDIWMKKLSKQFIFLIVNDNVVNLLLAHRATLLSSFNSIDQSSLIPPTALNYPVQYVHDRLVYAATVNVAVSVSKSSKHWKSSNLHLSNDGFLYDANLTLQDSATYAHHRSDNW